jgi:ABC-type tungstate transport system substrate-binding protein
MSPQEIAARIAYAAAIAAVPIATMRADNLRYAMGTTLLALIGFSFSGGWAATAIAGVVLLAYQFYLRFAVTKWRWVVGTVLTLSAFLLHRATYFGLYWSTWHDSLKTKIFVAATGVAISMIVTCIEMKVQRFKETIKKDIQQAADAIKDKIKDKLAG